MVGAPQSSGWAQRRSTAHYVISHVHCPTVVVRPVTSWTRGPFGRARRRRRGRLRGGAGGAGVRLHLRRCRHVGQPEVTTVTRTLWGATTPPPLWPGDLSPAASDALHGGEQVQDLACGVPMSWCRCPGRTLPFSKDQPSGRCAHSRHERSRHCCIKRSRARPAKGVPEKSIAALRSLAHPTGQFGTYQILSLQQRRGSGTRTELSKEGFRPRERVFH